MPVRPMPSAVQARRVRIRARPRGIATVLGLCAVRLRAGDLHQIPTGLRQHNGRTACQRYGDRSDAQSLPHRGASSGCCSPRQRLNLLDPRLRQRNARAAVPSSAINFTVGTERCSARHPALSRLWHQADIPRPSASCPLSGNSGQTCSRGFDRIGRE